ncbi:MAG: hypothetical protein KFB95_07340 [Simkaniaceae bacterium]|nr:MAG: hypothetical protein KFB95_07340 [Simkaniaceae bacterium]
MSHTPEEDLARHLKQQEGEIHGNLFMLNQLFQLCADASLSEKDLLKQAVPIVEKLSKTNPMVAKEIKEVLATGDLKKIETYFEQEKDALIHTLTTEINEHKGINSRINKESDRTRPSGS